MATKKSAKPSARKRARGSKPRASAAPKPTSFAIPKQPDFGDLSKMAKGMTPEQAFDLYRANAKMALDIINTAIENTAKLRKHQFAGEEEARSMQKKALRHAAEASDPQAMMPDLRQAQNVVKAMQGVMSSGAPAFESMQRVIGDFTRMAQLPGLKR